MKKVLASAASSAALAVLLVGLHPAQANAATSGAAAAPVRYTAAASTSIPVRAVKSPTRITLKIKKIYQADPYWCSPASAEIALGTMGVNVSQRTLARKMKTDHQVGTWDYNAIPVLNSYARKKGYKVIGKNDVYNPKKLAERVVYDVGVLRRAVPIQLYMNKLPWYKGMFTKNVGHIVVAYGYDKKTKTIRIWDPYNYYGTGGDHNVSVKTLAKSTQSAPPNRYYGIYFIAKR